MKEWLAKYVIRKSIGVAISDQQVALCVVAFTPLGWVEVGRQVESSVPDRLEESLGRLLAPWIGRGGKTSWPVTLGLPTLRVFYTTRPLSVANSSASPELMLQEVLQTPHAGSDDMAVDLIKCSPGKRPLATLASCRKRYLSGLVTTLVERGARLSRAEPAPCALVRLAAARQRNPRGAKLVARLVLGPGQGLGILADGQHPLVCRSFALPDGGEPQAIFAALSALRMLARSCGIGLPIDAVVIHGRPDLGPMFDPAEFRSRTEADLFRSDTPDLDAASMALGSALGAMSTGPTFDLARNLKPQSGFREIFPWGETALQVAMLVCVSLFLWRTDCSLKEILRAAEAKTARIRWLRGVAESQLLKDKASLEQKTEAAEKFLASRIDWSEHTREVADWLPENVHLMSLQGTADLVPAGPSKGGPKPKKSLVLHLSTPIPEHGAIDRCLASLGRQALLKRDFPSMKLADMKWNPPLAGKEPVATFSVVCEPKADAGAMAKPSTKSKKAAAGGS